MHVHDMFDFKYYCSNINHLFSTVHEGTLLFTLEIQVEHFTCIMNIDIRLQEQNQNIHRILRVIMIQQSISNHC